MDQTQSRDHTTQDPTDKLFSPHHIPVANWAETDSSITHLLPPLQQTPTSNPHPWQNSSQRVTVPSLEEILAQSTTPDTQSPPPMEETLTAEPEATTAAPEQTENMDELNTKPETVSEAETTENEHHRLDAILATENPEQSEIESSSLSDKAIQEPIAEPAPTLEPTTKVMCHPTESTDAQSLQVTPQSQNQKEYTLLKPSPRQQVYADLVHRSFGTGTQWLLGETTFSALPPPLLMDINPFHQEREALEKTSETPIAIETIDCAHNESSSTPLLAETQLPQPPIEASEPENVIIDDAATESALEEVIVTDAATESALEEVSVTDAATESALEEVSVADSSAESSLEKVSMDDPSTATEIGNMIPLIISTTEETADVAIATSKPESNPIAIESREQSKISNPWPDSTPIFTQDSPLLEPTEPSVDVTPPEPQTLREAVDEEEIIQSQTSYGAKPPTSTPETSGNPKEQTIAQLPMKAVPVENLLPGIVTILADAVEAIVTPTWSAIAPNPRPLQESTVMTDRMRQLMSHSTYNIFSGVGAMVSGTLTIITGITGCITRSVTCVGMPTTHHSHPTLDAPNTTTYHPNGMRS